jgi:large subunit ribosomal protein L21
VYAVIRSGGKQERVSEGQLVRLELLGASVGDEVTLTPVLVVGDGGELSATPGDLDGVTVTGRVVGEELGPKIDAMTYKSKTNQRRRWGHRQRYSTVEILTIGTAKAKGRPARSGGRSRAARAEAGEAEPAAAP